MASEDRRKSRRVRLQLPIAWARSAGAGGKVWTTDVSAGGMYFWVPAAGAPGNGEELAFELSVPPGAGYSPSAGKVKGAGEVVRTTCLSTDRVGVAIRFTRSLDLEF